MYMFVSYWTRRTECHTYKNDKDSLDFAFKGWYIFDNIIDGYKFSFSIIKIYYINIKYLNIVFELKSYTIFNLNSSGIKTWSFS